MREADVPTYSSITGCSPDNSEWINWSEQSVHGREVPCPLIIILFIVRLVDEPI